MIAEADDRVKRVKLMKHRAGIVKIEAGLSVSTCFSVFGLELQCHYGI